VWPSNTINEAIQHQQFGIIRYLVTYTDLNDTDIGFAIGHAIFWGCLKVFKFLVFQAPVAELPLVGPITIQGCDLKKYVARAQRSRYLLAWTYTVQGGRGNNNTSGPDCLFR